MLRAHASRVDVRPAHESHKRSTPTSQARHGAHGREALAERSPVVQRLRRIDEIANDSPAVVQARHYDELANNDRSQLPAGLRSGLEQLSGLDLSPVRVHYDSPEPGKLDALAITRGRDIHLGPGQESHLPHESWHAVQQMRDMVEPTSYVGGVAINDSPALEREADVMGTRAEQLGRQSALDGQARSARPRGTLASIPSAVVQPKWKTTVDDGIWMWTPPLDGVTWYANEAGLLWYEITNESGIEIGTVQDYKYYEGKQLRYEEWLQLRSQSDEQAVESKFKGPHAKEFDKIWMNMVARMKDSSVGYVIRFYNDAKQANSHAFQNGDVWIDPGGQAKVKLAAWHMFAGQMPDNVKKASPFVSFATNLSSLVNAAEAPFGSAAVKGIVKGGKKEFRGKKGLEALARPPAAKIGLFAIPAKLLIHGKAISPFIEGIRKTNPSKYSDLAAHFEDENEATIYSPDTDVSKFLIAEYENPYLADWQ